MTEVGYEPTINVNCSPDFEIPDYVQLGGELVKVPKVFKAKSISYIINEHGKLDRNAWISKSLAHILNYDRLGRDKGVPELVRSLIELDKTIGDLIKYKVLRSHHRCGAMAFAQANENVPKDCLLISKRTYEALCSFNPGWKDTSHVVAIRYPNLGPGTTKVLRLLVNSPMDYEDLPANSIFNLAPTLRDLLEDAETEDQRYLNIVEAFYLHPETLKGGEEEGFEHSGMEGDSDGDTIFIYKHRRGNPIFRDVSMVRKPGRITQESIDKLLAKSDRCERTDLRTWLPNYFSDIPIGQATYAIRWLVFRQLKRCRAENVPMHKAWQKIAARAIEMVEFVMDIRKGDYSDTEIRRKLGEISDLTRQITIAKANGNWFAQTVTSGQVEDVAGFCKRFPTLQRYVDYVTGQDLKETHVQD